MKTLRFLFKKFKNIVILAQSSSESTTHSYSPELIALLTAQRGFWLRIATVQLGHSHDAEDVVQQVIEALLSGIHMPKTISPEAWAMGVLRHKIIDVLRDRRRYLACDPLLIEQELDSLSTNEFNEVGHWRSNQTWAPDPADTVAHQQEMQFLQWCLAALPQNTQKIFLWREYLAFSFAEIEVQCGLSADHLRVLLHRTRLKLRQCLAQKMSASDFLEPHPKPYPKPHPKPQ